MRAVRPIVVLATVAGLVVGVGAASHAAPAPSAEPRPATAPASRDDEGRDDLLGGVERVEAVQAETDALARLNQHRAQAGLRPLVLEDEAQFWAYESALDSALAGAAGPADGLEDRLAPWVVLGQLWSSGPDTAGVTSTMIDNLVNSQPAVALSATATRVGIGYTTRSGQAYLHVILTDDPFSDVTTGDPFAEDIFWLVSNHVTTGHADGTFRPTATVTREAMAAFLFRFIDLRPSLPSCDTAQPQPFTDVTTGHPFCGAIAWLADEEISTGYPDGSFRPGASVTREAMAAFLFRWLNFWNRTDDAIPTCDPGTARQFSDVPASHPFCGAIEWLASVGVSTGWPDGTFRPGLAIERQAMAAFLVRFDDLL